MQPYEEYESDEAPRGWSPGLIALVASLVVILGLGGAVAGSLLAKSHPAPTTIPTLTTGDVATTASPTDSASPSGSPSASPSFVPTGAFALPDVSGVDFRQARLQLRALKLGVNVVFEGTTEGDFTVDRTSPQPQSSVHAGVTVTIYVKASAPQVEVPLLVGMTCSAAAAVLGDAGLYPEYPTGKVGVVLSQKPGPPATLLWNGHVKISCGTKVTLQPPDSPTPTPTP
jgi:hypothetical protein